MRAQLDNQRVAGVFLRPGWVLVNEGFHHIGAVERHGILVGIETPSCEIGDSKTCRTVRLQEGDGKMGMTYFLRRMASATPSIWSLRRILPSTCGRTKISR